MTETESTSITDASSTVGIIGSTGIDMYQAEEASRFRADDNSLAARAARVRDATRAELARERKNRSRNEQPGQKIKLVCVGGHPHCRREPMRTTAARTEAELAEKHEPGSLWYNTAALCAFCITQTPMFATCSDCTAVIPELVYDVSPSGNAPWQFGAAPTWPDQDQFCEECRLFGVSEDQRDTFPDEEFDYLFGGPPPNGESQEGGDD